MNNYAKIIVKGSPITKSNFKLFNLQGRAILPYNSGKYHDRYAVYEQEIAYEARMQNPNIILSESLIAVLRVYYKSKKRHPDTINITKSIFDGIEKSGLIINDAQVRKIIVEEFYDKENPRFELELFGESSYCIDYNIKKRESNLKPVEYGPPPNSKPKTSLKVNKEILDKNSCSICGKKITNNDCFSANKGTMKICKECFKKSF
ncbi:MAG: RusA family crossover junction endodeoxyribonuclease [Clostridium cochlearium]|uniref:RusA family crossover junction endodeoxyribonuclease n=1 Tax=Clostridium cochlearium TaxID=1494 RepID=UPI00280BCED0|nr:RusA family crossover junction endodeoxyribonuclease [Clostridium cochlearium]MDU1442704.1 RusA family crossover junction endodeoxyribonuclease [Clostridium cochlearium]